MLGLALVWLARRTRRYVNVPLAAGAVVVLVTLLVGVVGLVGVGNKVDTVRDGVYAATLSTAQARIAGFDAKSNESLGADRPRLGRRLREGVEGLGRRSSRASSTKLSAEPARPPTWPRCRGTPYAEVHQQIRALDDNGNWDGAVRLATGSSGSSGNAAFASFDESSGQQLTNLRSGHAPASSTTPAAGSRSPRSPGSLAGLIAALCAWWGLSLRLEEYR